MNRRLQRNEKEAIRKKYSDNIYFRYLQVPCKTFERYLLKVRLSPEEVFLESLSFVDEIRRHPEDAANIVCKLWNSLFCDIRELVPDADEQEIEHAVAVIVYADSVLANSGDSTPLFMGVLNGLMLKYMLRNKKKEIDAVEGTYREQMNRTDPNAVKKEFCDYIQSDRFISDEIEQILDGKTPLAEQVKNTEEVEENISATPAIAKRCEPRVKIKSRKKSRVEVVLTAMFRAGYLESAEGKKSTDAMVKVLMKQLFGADAKNLQQDRNGLDRYGDVEDIFTELNDAYKKKLKKSAR